MRAVAAFGLKTSICLLSVSLVSVPLALAAGPQARMPVTTQDIDMALEVIARNTLRVPGMTPGSRISIGPGPFSASDAVVLLALKSASRDRRLLPEAAFTSACGRSIRR